MSKFNELDTDESAVLEGKEVLSMAEWVWQSFHPGEKITAEEREKEAKKVLKSCDTNGDGGIDKEEFLIVDQALNH